MVAVNSWFRPQIESTTRGGDGGGDGDGGGVGEVGGGDKVSVHG